MTRKKTIPTASIVRSSAAEYLTFVAATGDQSQSFEMRYEGESYDTKHYNLSATIAVGAVPDIWAIRESPLRVVTQTCVGARLIAPMRDVPLAGRDESRPYEQQ